MSSHYTYSNMNDAFKHILYELLNHGEESFPRGMKTKEIISPRIELTKPYERWVTSKVRNADPVYAIGELFWYLSGTNKLDFIEYYAPSIGKYSDDGQTLNSAYGHRIFNKWFDQWKNIKQILKEDPDSRQAIIFIREPKDLILKTKDSVCTNTLHFLIRDNKLILIVSMRSNDVTHGFIYDVFCFTMLQEIMAHELGIEMGSYIHIPNSLHLYEPWFEKAKKIIDEDYNYFSLGKMTFYNTFDISYLTNIEEVVREQSLSEAYIEIDHYSCTTDYWKNILSLLLFKKMIKENDFNFIDPIKDFFKGQQNYYFLNYIERKMNGK